MGVTSENVAEKFGVTRETQDHFAVLSHNKALHAQKEGWLHSEITPYKTKVKGKDGEETEVNVNVDEGPRAGSTFEKL